MRGLIMSETFMGSSETVTSAEQDFVCRVGEQIVRQHSSSWVFSQTLIDAIISQAEELFGYETRTVGAIHLLFSWQRFGAPSEIELWEMIREFRDGYGRVHRALAAFEWLRGTLDFTACHTKK